MRKYQVCIRYEDGYKKSVFTRAHGSMEALHKVENRSGVELTDIKVKCVQIIPSYYSYTDMLRIRSN